MPEQQRWSFVDANVVKTCPALAGQIRQVGLNAGHESRYILKSAGWAGLGQGEVTRFQARCRCSKHKSTCRYNLQTVSEPIMRFGLPKEKEKNIRKIFFL